jgi:hypothetical protein
MFSTLDWLAFAALSMDFEATAKGFYADPHNTP